LQADKNLIDDAAVELPNNYFATKAVDQAAREHSRPWVGAPFKEAQQQVGHAAQALQARAEEAEQQLVNSKGRAEKAEAALSELRSQVEEAERVRNETHSTPYTLSF